MYIVYDGNVYVPIDDMYKERFLNISTDTWWIKTVSSVLLCS
jgi:hypothetical protein